MSSCCTHRAWQGASKFRGVSFNKNMKSKPWRSQIKLPGQSSQLEARFATEEEAAHDYDRKAIRRDGRCAPAASCGAGVACMRGVSKHSRGPVPSATPHLLRSPPVLPQQGAAQLSAGDVCRRVQRSRAGCHRRARCGWQAAAHHCRWVSGLGCRDGLLESARMPPAAACQSMGAGRRATTAHLQRRWCRVRVWEACGSCGWLSAQQVADWLLCTRCVQLPLHASTTPLALTPCPAARPCSACHPSTTAPLTLPRHLSPIHPLQRPPRPRARARARQERPSSRGSSAAAADQWRRRRRARRAAAAAAAAAATWQRKSSLITRVSVQLYPPLLHPSCLAASLQVPPPLLACTLSRRPCLLFTMQAWSGDCLGAQRFAATAGQGQHVTPFGCHALLAEWEEEWEEPAATVKDDPATWTREQREAYQVSCAARSPRTN